MIKDLHQRARRVRLLAMDVDGVLTNGKINLDEQGREIKVFDVQDGFGIVLFRRAGYQTAIISARSAGAVTARAADLKIDHVYQDAYPKTQAYEDLLATVGLPDEQICFIGDDLPDMCLFRRVGLAVAVSNASPEAKACAHYVTRNRGGEGSVREVVEMILKAQDRWAAIVEGHY